MLILCYPPRNGARSLLLRLSSPSFGAPPLHPGASGPAAIGEGLLLAQQWVRWMVRLDSVGLWAGSPSSSSGLPPA